MLFVFKARRRAHSRAYVTGAVTQKTDDRASKIGKLFLDDSLVGAVVGGKVGLHRTVKWNVITKQPPPI